MSKKLLSSTLLVLALSNTDSRAADENVAVVGESMSVIVAFDDLDTSNKLDAAALLRRIEAAAKAVCGPAPLGNEEVEKTVDFDACVSMAVGNAVIDANIPLVKELYESGETTLAQR